MLQEKYRRPSLFDSNSYNNQTNQANKGKHLRY